MTAEARNASFRNPSFTELYTPKLVTVLREGYGFSTFKADVLAGLTVAIVALPLSMAIAIASGVTPDRGLYTSIVGGFVISALGGSRFQIGGPAGAFIVLVAAAVQQHGLDGLLLATFMSGLILLGVGVLRLGTFIKYIPYPVTVGFTSGIAIIIFSSQIKDLLGLTLHGAEPGPIIAKFEALGAALPTLNLSAAAVALLTIAVVVGVRRLRPHWPAFLIGTVVAALLVWLLGLPVETLGTRFGGIPRSLPAPALPAFSLGKAIDLLPTALAFALLGGIESLLSAVVADSMTGRRHRSNAELVAQGLANIASSLFGGICVTGAIARTATNIRAGSRGPVSGILHSAFVLAFMLIAAPLASYTPLAALAAILAVVCWNMAERHQFATLVRASAGDAAVVTVTFLVVVFRDLTEGILTGFTLGSLLFLHRMSQAVEVEPLRPIAEPDMPDANGASEPPPYDLVLASNPDIVAYRISGAFFFGAAATVAAALDSIGEHPKAYLIDFSAVPVIDSTAASTIHGVVRKAARGKASIQIVGARPAVLKVLLAHGVRPPQVHYKAHLAEAVKAVEGDRSARS
ncbi:SulP family inorganic anion transporter [Labrys okinawensis]|uniref:SulP family inorganic anion transporter n=1 Tax=Labrys okinawensis TaxID=346911 RepID=UPI0039BD3647